MKFLIFYKKKIAMLTRIKFITFKTQFLIKFFTDLFFTFKVSSGLSVGSSVFYFMSLARLPFNVKNLFFKLNYNNKYNNKKKSSLPILNFKFLPKLNNFWFVKFFFLATHYKFNTEDFFLKILNSGIQFVQNTPEQTFLGFSGQLFDGARFSETHHSSFWQMTKSKTLVYKDFKNFSIQYNSALYSKISLEDFIKNQYYKYNFILSIFNYILKY